MGAPGVAIAIGALGLIAKKLLDVEEDAPIQDETKPTLSTRGSYIPVLIGTRRIAPFIAWTGNRVKQEEPAAGGKGINTGGANDQIVWYEDGIHVLAVGPATALHAIKINGKNAKFNNGDPVYSPALGGFPSGSAFTTADGDEFEIYWGDSYNVEPINDWIGDATRLGISTRWPWMVIVVWKKKRLGGFPTWPSLQYDLECRPVVTEIDTSAWAVPSWMNNGPGPNGQPHTILGTNNSSLVGDPVDFPYVKVWNNGSDASDLYPPQGYAEISGQPNPQTNKVYIIDYPSYNAAETYKLIVESGYNDSPNGVVDENLSLWQKSIGVTVSQIFGLPATDYPSGFNNTFGAIYEMIYSSTTFDMAGMWFTTVDVGGNEDNFTDGAQRLVFWIKGLDSIIDTCNEVHIGFAEQATLFGHNAKGEFERDFSGDIITSSTNDAIVSIQPAGNNWHKVVVSYKTGEGNDPLTTADVRQLFIFINGKGIGQQTSLRVFHSGNTESPLKLNTGTTFTGITTIALGEPLAGAIDDVGQIEGYANGTGADGPNPAYTIAQLLFERYPHGRGLDSETWHLSSLEALGVAAESEGMRLHVLADQGKTATQALGTLLQDLHAYIAWDPTLGKYIFGLIRPNDAVVTIPKESLASDQPEHETTLDPDTSNLVIFSFTDRDLGYRKNTQPVHDDAASYENNRVTTTIDIETATDIFAARTIAERKRAEVTIPLNKYTQKAKNESRNLVPGTSIIIQDFPSAGTEELLRLLEIDINPDETEAVLTLSTDVYTIADSGSAEPVYTPQAGGEEESDITSSIWELPIFLADGEVSVALLRIASNSLSLTANIYGSTTDESYTYLGSNTAAIGATLVSEIPDNTSELLENIVVVPLGGRSILEVPSLSDVDWARGRTLVYINGEIFYMKKITPTGDGGYILDGLLRARLASEKIYHVSGSTVYIFKESELTKFTDLSFSPGTTLYMKAVQHGISLALGHKASRDLMGFGIRPLPVVGIRTDNLTNSYRSGEGITIRWGFFNPESFKARYGSGFQKAGEPKEEIARPTVGGFFRVRAYNGLALLRERETSDATWTYSNAALIADTGGPEPDITIEVEMILHGYRSEVRTVFIEKL